MRVWGPGVGLYCFLCLEYPLLPLTSLGYAVSRLKFS